ncbi:hypothetical protein EYF80_014036 [Liparis tanakae]|uniref:Uncharacterized protein n=1 Tax=Liparis tanakae TaxID=230148 RepID=A0A4Z2IF13_9TELE|nr:hypothetical protein EYF80_014036 [Liparis tanakae]
MKQERKELFFYREQSLRGTFKPRVKGESTCLCSGLEVQTGIHFLLLKSLRTRVSGHSPLRGLASGLSCDSALFSPTIDQQGCK